MKKYLIVLLIISSCTKENSYKLPIYGRKVISEKIINGEKLDVNIFVLLIKELTVLKNKSIFFSKSV